MRRSHGFYVVPGQQVFDVSLFVSTRDGGQDTGKVAMGFDSVEFAGLDQGCDDGPVLRSGIMACEERIFAVEGDGTDGALDGVGIQFDATVVDEPT